MVAGFLLKSLSVLLLLSPLATEKEYVKLYLEGGILKEEGWMKNNIKENYWIYYFNDGSPQKKGHYHKGKQEGYWYFYSQEKNLIKEGHFRSGKKEGWWIFYEQNEKIKVQFENGKREGFALIFNNNKLKKAIKFEENKKTGEWTSLWRFKKDNPQVKF